jgi:hypothetical protein
MVVANRTSEEIQKDVAESIRVVAEQVIASADEYAVGMDYATGLRILMEFQINSVPSITVQKDISCAKTIADNRCRIWTRYVEQE